MSEFAEWVRLTSYERVETQSVDEDVIYGWVVGKEFGNDVEIWTHHASLVQQILQETH